MLADVGGQSAPPDAGNIVVRQQEFFGNRVGESMRSYGGRGPEAGSPRTDLKAPGGGGMA